METVRVYDLVIVRVQDGLDIVRTALNLEKNVEITDLASISLASFPCNCKLTSLNFVRISVDWTGMILYL